MNPSKKFHVLRSRFSPLYQAVCHEHQRAESEGNGHRGHGIDHDLVVAQYCLLIAPTDRSGILGWLAAMLHSMDRVCSSAERKIREMIDLLPADITNSERQSIITAVLGHDGPNDKDDDQVKITLQDADRLAGLSPLVILRIGQHRANIPAIQPNYISKRNPFSTYKNPTSALEDIHGRFDWRHDPRFRLRLPKAKRISEKYFRFLDTFVRTVENEFKQLGLDPWPD